MQSFVEIGQPVQEKKIFEGFLPYMGMASILVMIYIHIVDLESLMLHAKFQDPSPLGSGQEDF